MGKPTFERDGVQDGSNSRSKYMAGTYYQVRCGDCENEQIVFGKASTVVNCAVCGTTLARPTGGKAEIEHEILEPVETR